MFEINVTRSAGNIATALATRTLFQIYSLISINPSITNYPAYVPVIVEL